MITDKLINADIDACANGPNAHRIDGHTAASSLNVDHVTGKLTVTALYFP